MSDDLPAILIECDLSGHGAGLNGCEPDQPAKWVVFLKHAPHGGGCRPAHALVCQGAVIWIRSHLAVTVHCKSCRGGESLADLIEIVAPIDPSKR